jgi:uncharacterized protein (TIGR02266 family)
MVDDVPMFRELVALFLARTASVVTASSADEALVVLRRQRIDLVITDLHMPTMDGAELCRTIKADPLLERVPVLLLLRAGDDEDSARAVQAGADDMLCKPISRGALIQAVNHYLETGLSRGLPRVAIQTPVRLRSDILQAWGTARNISRGGVYVQADCDFVPKTRLWLDLVLPDTSTTISPTAQVVWSREADDLRVREMGLRFLHIDADTMQRLDDYIATHPDDDSPAAAPVTGSPV